MEKHEELFTPERIDEQIEQRAGDLPAVSDVQFLSEMRQIARQMREEQEVSLRQVEDRLMKHALTRAVSAASAPSEQPQWSSSARAIQQGRSNRMEKKQASKFGRRVSMLVAVLITAILVGSLIAVLSLTHQNTETGHGTKATPTPAPTLTATSTPAPVEGFGQTLYTTPTNQWGFSNLAWSPDSKRVASDSVTTLGGVQIWDATTGNHLVNIYFPGGTNEWADGFSWSPNSQLLAIGTNQEIVIVNGQSGATVRSYPISTIASVSSSINGSYFSEPVPAGGGLGVRGLAWSPDGSLLAVSISGGVSGTLEVVNAQTGALVYTLPITGNYVPTAVAWSSDGKYIAANVFNTEPGNSTVPADQLQMIWAWNVSTRQIAFKHAGGSGTGDPLAWQPHTSNLAFTTHDSGESISLAIADVATGKLVQQYTVAAFGPVAWSPDGTYLAYVSYSSQTKAESQVSIIDVNNHQQVYVYKQHSLNVGALAWSPNGKYIVSGEGNTQGNMVAKVWTAE